MLAFTLAAVVMLSSPSGTGAAEPHLASLRDGSVVMSWLEPGAGKTHALKFARLKNGRWSEPRTIVERSDFFVNWADFPSIVEDAKGTLFAHWLQKSGSGTYAYDVRIASSRDGGTTWSASRVLHDDGKQAEHGFVSMVPLAKGGVGAVWLDGRDESAMSLRYAEIDAALKIANERVLDARVCECCTTAMTMTSSGPVVAYRDRSMEEVRDIGVMRVSQKDARVVNADGWKIAGCPVNGPQLASRGNRVAIAWFTAPENKPRVNVAFSRDAGATFGAPLRVDGGNPIGRVDVLLLPDDSALVTWLEGDAILLRRVRANGSMDAPQKLAATTSARASGFPRAVLIGTTAYFAWTDATAKQIRVGKADFR